MPTIALVDDDRNILTSVSIALEAEGYRITTYTDGASALDGFKTVLPDLAILDIDAPGQTRHLVHEPIRQEALAGDHRARPERAPYHFGDDRANMRRPTSGSGQKTAAR